MGAFHEAGIFLVKKDKPVKADAIVILMGSMYERIKQAADLYENNYSSKVLIVEPEHEKGESTDDLENKDINYGIVAKDMAVALGIPSDSIIVLPGHANSTQMEAIIIREYITFNPNIKSLLLVSSSPHMRRASMIFSTAFRKSDQNILVVSIPSRYTNFDSERWWKNRHDLFYTFEEYLKIANYIMIDKWKL